MVADLFRELEEAAPAPVESRFFRLAGGLVRVDFGSEELAGRLMPALAHLECEPGAQELTIQAWSGGSLPPLPRPERGVVLRRLTDERFLTAFQNDERLLSMIDVERGRAVYWCPEAERLPYYESGSPLRLILNRWLGERNLWIVHAAAVGDERGGLLLAGPPGSGKSSTSLLCLQRGPGFLSEDYTVVELSTEPVGHSLYSSAKLLEQDRARLPDLEPARAAEKLLFFLPEHRLARRLPLKALLLPRVSGRAGSSLSPASAAEALRALAPATVFQLPGVGNRAFPAMAELARRLPCYHLELGTRRGEIVELLETLL